MPQAQPAPQKSLVVIFKVGLLRDAGAKTLGVWYWGADEADAWLAPRRALFPGAWAQEMVALALLPLDAREALAGALCGLPEGSADGVEMSALDEPKFDALSDSCAVCVVQGAALDIGARGRKAIGRPWSFSKAGGGSRCPAP